MKELTHKNALLIAATLLSHHAHQMRIERSMATSKDPEILTDLFDLAEEIKREYEHRYLEQPA